jgi:hypothetical protein
VLVWLLAAGGVSVAAAWGASAGAGSSARAEVIRPGSFTTAIQAGAVQTDETALGFRRIRESGAAAVKLLTAWSQIAPKTPAGTFDAANPDDPGYDWTELDAGVRAAVAAKLEPLVVLYGAPSWARQNPKVPGTNGGEWGRPLPDQLAMFAHAAAVHYDGKHAEPRVRYWILWNEPNISPHLAPQFLNGRAVAASWYRLMLNAATKAVHQAEPTDRLVVGGLSPFTVNYGEVVSVGPLRFMRQLLCMSAGLHPHPTCAAKTAFDIWATNPYTTGGPFHQAANPDDVSLGDLPEMNALLAAAYKAGHITSSGRPPFWVTEFSWDTSPPDPTAVPVALQARWVAEALYQMWHSGVSLVSWLQLRDEPYPSDSLQGGLYYSGQTLAGDRPKPALTAFRFPLVAFARSSGVFLWGRAPAGSVRQVAVERKQLNQPWRRLTTVTAGGDGVFHAVVKVKTGKGDLFRARAGGSLSLSFALHGVDDRFYRPFGN